MPNSSDILTAVSLRLRDTANVAYPTAVLNRLIDQCQRVLNCHQRAVIKTINFATSPNRALYTVAEIAADAARVEMVRQNQRNLFDVSWDSLVHQDRLWMRRLGVRCDYFSRIGNDLLVIAPALHVSQTVQVVYTTVTAAPTGLVNDIAVPAEFVPMLQDLVEATALLRSRKFTEAKNPVERVKAVLTGMGNESMETQGG